MIEGDIFRTTVGIPDPGHSETSIPIQLAGEITGEVQRLVKIIKGELSRSEIQQAHDLWAAEIRMADELSRIEPVVSENADT